MNKQKLLQRIFIIVIIFGSLILCYGAGLSINNDIINNSNIPITTLIGFIHLTLHIIVRLTIIYFIALIISLILYKSIDPINEIIQNILK